MKRWRIRFPPGTGEAAVYTEDEMRLLTDVLAQVRSGAITPEEGRRQYEVLHTLKVTLGAVMLPPEMQD